MAYSNIHTFSDPEWDPLYSGSKTHERPARELSPTDPHLPRGDACARYSPRSAVHGRGPDRTEPPNTAAAFITYPLIDDRKPCGSTAIEIISVCRSPLPQMETAERARCIRAPSQFAKSPSYRSS